MRGNRDNFGKMREPNLPYEGAYRQMTIERVADFLEQTPTRHQVFTSEGLSWLRYPDEMAILRKILQADRRQIHLILYLRDKAEFAESYRKQIYNSPGRTESQNPASVCYIERDSWILDYDALIAAYRDGFPDSRFSVIDYDEEVGRVGSIIPSFIETMGVAADCLPDYRRYFLNKTRAKARIARAKGIRKSFKSLKRHLVRRA